MQDIYFAFFLIVNEKANDNNVTKVSWGIESRSTSLRLLRLLLFYLLYKTRWKANAHIAFSLKKKYNIPKLYRISGKDLRRSEYKFRWLPVLRGRKKTERSSSFWHWIWNFVIGFSGKKEFSSMRLVITFISCGMLCYIMRFSRNFQEFILKDKWMVNF